MWYGDYAPSSGHHPKKPLSKKQLKKIQEAYNKVDSIQEYIKEQEEKEKKDTNINLDTIF